MAQTKGEGKGVAEFATGTLISRHNLLAVLVDTGADLQAEDDAPFEAVERALSIIQPLMYVVPSASAGKIHCIVDGSQFDASAVQAQLQAIGTQEANSYSFASATVTLGTDMAIS